MKEAPSLGRQVGTTPGRPARPLFVIADISSWRTSVPSNPAGIAATKSGDRQVNSKVERGDMMSFVTQTSDVSPTHDDAAFAISPPESALRAVARERAHELLAVGQLGGSVHVRPWCLLAGAILSCSYPFGTT